MEKAYYAGARDARNGEESVKRRPRRFLPVAFAAMTIAAAAAHAKTTAWIGTESGTLSTAAKWNNGLPEAGDSIVISNVAEAAISVVNDLEALEYNALHLHGAKAINLSGEPFTLTGSVEMKAAGSVVDNFITNTSSTAKLAVINSTCTCTFNGDVVRTRSATTYLTEGPGTLTLNGRLIVPSTVYFRPRSSQSIRCNGPVIVTKCDGTYENPFYGVNYLSSTENEIGTLNLNYYSFILEKDNVLSPDTVISFTGHENRGDLRLNGHSQVANRLSGGSAVSGNSSRINSTGTPTLTLKATASATTGASIRDKITLVYWPDDGSCKQTFENRVSTTSGDLVVSNGTIALTGTTTFPNVPRVEVAAGATFDMGSTTRALIGLKTLQMGENARFKAASAVSPFSNFSVAFDVAQSSLIEIPAGLDMACDSFKVGGVPLAKGRSYTGADNPSPGDATPIAQLSGSGRIYVPYSVNGAVFTWIGGSDGDALASAANWKGGEAPSFDGSENLVFGEGTARAVVSGTVSAYSISIVTNAPFTLAAADDGAKILLGDGGLTITNAVDSTVVAHTISCPMEIYSSPQNMPQTWFVASNATFSNAAPVSSSSASSALTLRSYGRTYFCADNSSLLAPLVITNISTASQPYIYNMKGLGAPSRFTTVWGANPRFITSSPSGGSLTNETPLRLHSGLTNTEGAYINSSSNAKLYLAGKVAFVASGSISQPEMYFHGETHFIGGVTNESTKYTSWRIVNNHVWIEGDGIRQNVSLIVDYGGTVHIAAPSNSWTQLQGYKNAFMCHGTNVLAKGKPVCMSSDTQVYRSSATVLDLNGYGQSVSRFYPGWSVKSYPEIFTTLRSATPAMLEIAADTAYDDVLPVKVTGAAGIKFNAAGSLTFTNFTASTTGTLEVDRGTVRFAAGSGWTAATNVVLAGGTLAVGAGAGAKAFGPQQGKSAAWMTYTDGTLEIAADEEATMCAVAVPKGNGHFRYLAPGVYGGAAAGLDAAHTLGWIAGGGRLRILRSGDSGTIIIVK